MVKNDFLCGYSTIDPPREIIRRKWLTFVSIFSGPDQNVNQCIGDNNVQINT
jgi:hypothetical protein